MPRRTLMNKTIPVILLEDDRHLGEKYEQVRVAPSFARNVLLPGWKAVLATKVNIHNYAQKMEAAEEKRKNRAASIDEFLMKVQQDGGLVFTEKVNEKGVLYGKIGEDKIVSAIKEKYGVEIQSHYIRMEKKLSEAGDYQVPFQYRDVKKNIIVKIVGEMDEIVAKKAEEIEESAAEEATE